MRVPRWIVSRVLGPIVYGATALALIILVARRDQRSPETPHSRSGSINIVSTITAAEASALSAAVRPGSAVGACASVTSDGKTQWRCFGGRATLRVLHSAAVGDTTRWLTIGVAADSMASLTAILAGDRRLFTVPRAR
jgi:hypothetical protein